MRHSRSQNTTRRASGSFEARAMSASIRRRITGQSLSHAQLRRLAEDVPGTRQPPATFTKENPCRLSPSVSDFSSRGPNGGFEPSKGRAKKSTAMSTKSRQTGEKEARKGRVKVGRLRISQRPDRRRGEEGCRWRDSNDVAGIQTLMQHKMLMADEAASWLHLAGSFSQEPFL